MYNRILLIVFFVLNIFAVNVNSQAATFTENGITYIDTISGDTITRRADIFSDYSLSSEWGTITGHVGEYHYAEGGILTGWINLKEFKGEKMLQILMPTFTQTGTATFRLQGRVGDSGAGFGIYDCLLTSAQNVGINVVENVDWFRCGANINVIGTETFSVKLKANSGVPNK